MDWVGFMGFNTKKSNTRLNEQHQKIQYPTEWTKPKIPIPDSMNNGLDWGWLSLTQTLKIVNLKVFELDWIGLG